MKIKTKSLSEILQFNNILIEINKQFFRGVNTRKLKENLLNDLQKFKYLSISWSFCNGKTFVSNKTNSLKIKTENLNKKLKHFPQTIPKKSDDKFKQGQNQVTNK